MGLYNDDELFLLDEDLAEIEYQLGLKFCILNDNISAFYWFKCAAFKNHKKAIVMVHDMVERKLI